MSSASHKSDDEMLWATIKERMFAVQIIVGQMRINNMFHREKSSGFLVISECYLMGILLYITAYVGLYITRRVCTHADVGYFYGYRL